MTLRPTANINVNSVYVNCGLAWILIERNQRRIGPATQYSRLLPLLLLMQMLQQRRRSNDAEDEDG